MHQDNVTRNLDSQSYVLKDKITAIIYTLLYNNIATYA